MTTTWTESTDSVNGQHAHIVVEVAFGREREVTMSLREVDTRGGAAPQDSPSGAGRRPRISYVPLEAMDPQMQEEMRRCAREGTPRPESSAVRAHVPAAFWSFARSWHDLFRNGVCDHAIKDLCRVYISRSVKCEYCGNQRSEKARASGVEEGKYDDLLNFEASDRYSEREKAALAYAEAIAWRLASTDELWERLYANFSEEELVELGCMIALTLGQQSWLRLLDIEHHEVLAGTGSSMAPGFETPEALARAKADDGYWARRRTAEGDPGRAAPPPPPAAPAPHSARPRGGSSDA